MKDWLDAFGVVQLGWTVALLLVVPTAVGVLVDLRMGTAPWGILGGTLLGVGLATFGLARTILRRYGRLAPPPSNEEIATWPD